MNRVFPVLLAVCLLACAAGPLEVEFSAKDPDVLDTDVDSVESDPPVTVDSDPVDTVDSDPVDTVDTVDSPLDTGVDTISRYDIDQDGWTAAAGDCDDLQPSRHPLAPEILDGLDNDCDGLTDEGTVVDTDLADSAPLQDTFVAADTSHRDTYDTDFSCDGFDTYTQWELGCLGGDGDADGDTYTVAEGDCDDANPARHPGAVEIRDGIDNDCDGQTDEAGAPADGDGDGYTVAQGDCDDANRARNPGAAEVLDGFDNDCDGLTDEGVLDADRDGYTAAQGDCNDANASVHPNAPDPIDGVDRDCDGTDT